MKKGLTSLTALIIFALGFSPQSWGRSQDKKPKSRATPSEAASAATKPAEAESSPQGRAMKGLRDRLLTSSLKEVGLSGKDAKAKVWGVLMEVALPNGVATLVSIRDGTASLYTSTGGGVLGGYIAQKEAKRFVAEGRKASREHEAR